MGFTVNDPEVIGASSGHLFTASPGPAQLSPMMIVSVENGTSRTTDGWKRDLMITAGPEVDGHVFTAGLIDVPNPVSAVTPSPAGKPGFAFDFFPTVIVL